MVFGFRAARPLVGLDIGSSSVKAVQLKPSGKKHKLVAWGSETLPPDSIVDGEIVDGAAVAATIKQLLTRCGCTTADVAASLSGSAVIVKKLAVPAAPDAELEQTMAWEAEQHVPFDIQDVNLDFQVLDDRRRKTSPPADTMDVLLVAAKKEKIADYTSVILQAGAVPVVVDVDAFALQNAYEVNYGFTPGTVIVMLNVGASAINVHVVSGDRPTLTRDIAIGGNAYTEAIQKELGLPLDLAEQVKKGELVEGVSPEEVKLVLQATTENALREIQKTFDFFAATATSDRVDRIVLSGGGAALFGLADALSHQFGAPVDTFDPFRNIVCDPKRFAPGAAQPPAATAAVAVGLALRRAGDR